MTGQQIVDLLGYRCGNRTDLGTVAFLELAAAQAELENGAIKPWFLWQDYTDAGFVTVVDNEKVAVPSGFIGFDEEQGGLWWRNPDNDSDDAWEMFSGDMYADMKALSQRGRSAKTVDWLGDYFYLRPIPTEVYDLRLMGYFADAAPALGTANLWCTHAADWLLAKVGLRLATMHLQDDNLGRMFATDLGTASSRIVAENTRRRMNNKSLSRGV